MFENNEHLTPEIRAALLAEARSMLNDGGDGEAWQAPAFEPHDAELHLFDELAKREAESRDTLELTDAQIKRMWLSIAEQLPPDERTDEQRTADRAAAAAWWKAYLKRYAIAPSEPAAHNWRGSWWLTVALSILVGLAVYAVAVATGGMR